MVILFFRFVEPSSLVSTLGSTAETNSRAAGKGPVCASENKKGILGEKSIVQVASQV